MIAILQFNKLTLLTFYFKAIANQYKTTVSFFRETELNPSKSS